MKYVLYVITALYALLSAFAAIVQMKTAKQKSTSLMMLGGGLILIITVILHILNLPYNWIAAPLPESLVTS